MRTPLIFLLLFHCALGFAGESRGPSGRNCGLDGPPENAGETFVHGITLRVYPRALDLSKEYTGCQTTWLPDGSKWVALNIVIIEGGDPVRIWAADDSDPLRFSCIYKKGFVVGGDAKNCPVPQSLIAKSVAPGCIEKMGKAISEGGLSAPRPPGCKYE